MLEDRVHWQVYVLHGSASIRRSKKKEGVFAVSNVIDNHTPDPREKYLMQTPTSVQVKAAETLSFRILEAMWKVIFFFVETELQKKNGLQRKGKWTSGG